VFFPRKIFFQANLKLVGKKMFKIKKYFERLKKVREKHSSLFCFSIGDEEANFYNIDHFLKGQSFKTFFLLRRQRDKIS
jgi:hypothetical protein